MKSGRALTKSLVMAVFILATGIIAVAEDLNFSGIWLTNFGALTIIQQGDEVSGKYEFERSGELVRGRIHGTVKGDRLSFRWSQEPTFDLPSDAGDGYFILTHKEEDIVIRGEWRYGYSGPWKGEWKGSLVGLGFEKGTEIAMGVRNALTP